MSISVRKIGIDSSFVTSVTRLPSESRSVWELIIGLFLTKLLFDYDHNSDNWKLKFVQTPISSIVFFVKPDMTRRNRCVAVTLTWADDKECDASAEGRPKWRRASMTRSTKDNIEVLATYVYELSQFKWAKVPTIFDN